MSVEETNSRPSCEMRVVESGTTCGCVVRYLFGTVSALKNSSRLAQMPTTERSSCVCLEEPRPGAFGDFEAMQTVFDASHDPFRDT